MRIRRTLLVLAGLACVWLCVAPHPSEALSIGNVAVVEQTNFCQHCVDVEQENVALIFQDIAVSSIFVYSPAPGTLDPAWFTAMDNTQQWTRTDYCPYCTTPDSQVTQTNTVTIFQEIGVDGVLKGPGPMVTPGFPAIEIGNIAAVTQSNTCIDCQNTTQVNDTFIFQFLGLDDTLLQFLNHATLDTTVLNLATILQENTCSTCERVLQTNFTEIHQSINAVPEPGTFLLLGTGIAGLMFFGRKKLSNLTMISS
jgi:PEP-CTERM motif